MKLESHEPNGKVRHYKKAEWFEALIVRGGRNVQVLLVHAPKLPLLGGPLLVHPNIGQIIFLFRQRQMIFLDHHNKGYVYRDPLTDLFYEVKIDHQVEPIKNWKANEH